MRNIDPDLASIGKYLTLENSTFVIPKYQRPYSWDLQRCDKLWTSILEYVNSKESDTYFFGTIILNCQKNDLEYHIIDGQQRTITFFLLLKAFLLKINQISIIDGHDEKTIDFIDNLRDIRRDIMSILYKIDKNQVSSKPNDKKDSMIIENSEPLIRNNSLREVDIYVKDFQIIMSSISFEDAESKVFTFKRRQKDNKYTNYFRNFKYFYNTIDELDATELEGIVCAVLKKCQVISIKSWDLEQAIKMFNSLNSDNMPLTDADIILAELYGAAESKGEDSEFDPLWKGFQDSADSLEEKSIGSIDAILMQYMYYLRARNGDTVNEKGGINVTTPGLRKYFREVNKEAIQDPIIFTNNVISMTKLWEKAYEFPSVQVLLKLNENAKLFLASYLYRFIDTEGRIKDFTESRIYPVVKGLMKLFTILEVEEVGYSSKKFKVFLFGEERRMIDSNIPEEDIEKDFNKHIIDNWSPEDIAAKLQKYDNGALVYLNEYLFAMEKEEDFNLLNSFEIEHITPASGRNLQSIREDADLEDTKEFNSTINLLGNKILLESAINGSIGNDWFRTKLKKYKDSKYPIAKSLVENYKNSSDIYWKKENIINATNKASDRIAKYIFNVD